MFVSLLLNYVYTHFMHLAMMTTYSAAMKFLDRTGVDIHFSRQLIIILLGEKSPKMNEHAFLDVSYLVLIVLPMFIAGLKFWTAPVYLRYRSKINGTIVPLSVLPMFFSQDWDLMFMGMLVFFANFYSFWHHLVPNDEYYGGGYKRRRIVHSA